MFPARGNPVGWFESPRCKFLMMASSPFITPNRIMHGWWEPVSKEVLGVLELNGGDLHHLTRRQNDLDVVHITSIALRESSKGFGLFKTCMEMLIAMADCTGCCLYLCARAFKVDIPRITNERQFMNYITNMPGFGYLRDKDKEVWQSELLRRKYWEFGFKGLVTDDEDFESAHWMRNACGYCPDSASDEMKRCFGSRLMDDEKAFLAKFPTIYDSVRRRNRKRKGKKVA